MSFGVSLEQLNHPPAGYECADFSLAHPIVLPPNPDLSKLLSTEIWQPAAAKDLATADPSALAAVWNADRQHWEVSEQGNMFQIPEGEEYKRFKGLFFLDDSEIEKLIQEGHLLLAKPHVPKTLGDGADDNVRHRYLEYLLNQPEGYVLCQLKDVQMGQPFVVWVRNHYMEYCRTQAASGVEFGLNFIVYYKAQ